jgi:hypothetical protein
VDALKRAGRALQNKERKALLREARSRFHRAQATEKGLRLGRALLGLSFCHQHLGESFGAKTALEELVNVVDDTPAPDQAAFQERLETATFREPEEETVHSLLAFVADEHARLRSREQVRQASIDELERFILRFKQERVTTFIKQLIAEKKKLKVAAGKEQAAVEGLERIGRELLQAHDTSARQQKESAQKKAPWIDPRAVHAQAREKLESLKNSVRSYLKSQSRLTYNPDG